jgi:tRNA threonylcarbamoyladenosine modification (KEOPS) complex  Pcc1 subunit
MKAKVEIDTESPETFNRILNPSLESRGKVDLNTEVQEESFNVEVETDGIGPLRGTTDNVFRLASLARKITER